MTSKDHCQNTDSVRALDGSDEAPLHVDHQTNLDDMVPNATVFRQVNIMVDRDRGNDANLALGQFQATVRAFQEDGSSGPVQQTRKIPKWRDALLTLLMFLTVLFACLAYFGRLSWLFAGATVLLCAALLALPLWLEHRNWVKEAQRLDFEREHARTGMDPAVYERARKKRRQLILLGVFGALLLTGGIYALARVIYMQEHPDTDCRVCIAAPAYALDADIPAMEAYLASLVGDADGNGEVLTPVDMMELASGAWRCSGTFMGADLYIESLVEDGTVYALDQRYTLFLLVDWGYGDSNPVQNFKFYKHCAKLPEELRTAENAIGTSDRYHRAYRMDLRGTKLMNAAGFSDIPVYACISKSATEEEYEFAVDLLRKISAS